MTLLKDGTEDLHREIEAVVPLMRPSLTLEQYQGYLRKLYGYYKPLEAELMKVESGGFAIEPRLKSHLLEKDISQLGKSFDDIGHCSSIPRPATLSEAIGVMYVLEGSTLGAQILVRGLQKNENVKECPTNFLNPYEESTGKMWAEFRAQAEQVVPNQDHNVAVAFAQETFRSLAGWLKTNS